MRRLPLALALLFCGLFLGLPLLVMFGETVFGPDGFALAAYGEILGDPVDRLQLLYTAKLGISATAVALLCGLGHAWLTLRTDMPLARWLGPLGIVPLAMPPILVAMGIADLIDASGFWPCAVLLGVGYAPFVAVLAARGMRSVDGRLYEAALIARGRGAAERILLRLSSPEILAGCLFAFVFVISEHGVPEFLTVKGKAWHTYAEGIFARWTRRAMGVTHEDQIGPIVAAIPLLLVVAASLFVALRLRASTPIRSENQPLPLHRLGAWRFPALLLPLVYLGIGVALPIVVMVRWAAGSTQVNEPLSLATFRESVRLAIELAGDDLAFTVLLGLIVCVTSILVVLPLALAAARRHRWIEVMSVVPIAIPAILLGIGLVQVYNSRWLGELYDRTGEFYDSIWLLAMGYTARLLPFGVLTLVHAIRRQPASVDEAARLTGRGPVARFFRIGLPPLIPALLSVASLVFVLALRELDLAVVLPAGNDTVVRRLSNVVHFGGENMGGALALLLLLAAALFPITLRLLTGKKLAHLS